MTLIPLTVPCVVRLTGTYQRLLAIAMALLTAGCMSLSFGTLASLIAGVFLVGVCKGIGDTSVLATVSDGVSAAVKSKAIGLVELSWGGSSLIGMPLIGLLMSISWALPFYVLSAVAAAGGLWIAFAKIEQPPSPDEEVELAIEALQASESSDDAAAEEHGRGGGVGPVEGGGAEPLSKVDALSEEVVADEYRAQSCCEAWRGIFTSPRLSVLILSNLVCCLCTDLVFISFGVFWSEVCNIVCPQRFALNCLPSTNIVRRLLVPVVRPVSGRNCRRDCHRRPG
jgi:MFS family permease